MNRHIMKILARYYRDDFRQELALSRLLQEDTKQLRRRLYRLAADLGYRKTQRGWLKDASLEEIFLNKNEEF